jgi:ribosomal subunit interface protein
MQKPLQISYRHMEPSAAVETKIRERVKKLEQFCGDIMACHVLVEAPHQHHHKGKLYSVNIDIRLPEGEVVVNRNPAETASHSDVYVAIRDAFDAARRRVEDYSRRRRGQVKHHETPPHGRVEELYPQLDYGRITTKDGRSVYFHRNSVLNTDFDNLWIGAEVRFAEEMGEQGPKATSVSLVGKHDVVKEGENRLL